jgi:hypothetical protein
MDGETDRLAAIVMHGNGLRADRRNDPLPLTRPNDGTGGIKKMAPSRGERQGRSEASGAGGLRVPASYCSGIGEQPGRAQASSRTCDRLTKCVQHQACAGSRDAAFEPHATQTREGHCRCGVSHTAFGPRTIQRKPTWDVAVSIGSPWRAAGR